MILHYPNSVNQEQALVTSLDEACAPYLYAPNGNFVFNRTILGTEEPQSTFNSVAKLMIDTLQGGLNAPAAPTPMMHRSHGSMR